MQRATGGLTATTSSDRDYVLGTHDEEIERLGLQHRVWRPRALDAWRRAGFTIGQTLLDVGCGPGHAALDLAEIVGPSGQVVAIDRSARFLQAIEASRRQRGLSHIRTLELDLDEAEFPALQADGAWCRWIFAFVKDPRRLLQQIREALKPRGVLVFHEYLNYGTWQLSPRSPEFEEFVPAVMESWRASGGEPNVGLDLPRWLEELDFETRSMRTIMDVVEPSNYVWQWPKAFVEVGLERLVQLGALTPARAKAMAEAFKAAEATPNAMMVTPAVLETIAVRR